MTAVILEVLAIVVLVMINGVLSMSEAAVIASRKPLLGSLARDGRRNAGAALLLAREPGMFLSTVQVGITLLGVLSGAIGGATLTGELAGLLRGLPFIEGNAEEIALTVVVVMISFFSVVVGELVPKRLALGDAERIACAVAVPMQTLSRLMRPVVRMLAWSSSAVLRLARYTVPPEAPVTDREIRFMIDEAWSGERSTGRRRSSWKKSSGWGTTRPVRSWSLERGSPGWISTRPRAISGRSCSPSVIRGFSSAMET